MAGITLAQAQAKLQTWLDAEDAVANNQSYSIGNRSLSRANLGEIREAVEFWDTKVKRLSRSKRRTRFAVPC